MQGGDGRVATLKVRELGDYIREQRNGAQISLRQLARLAGVSNPYLSQIERGLRKPSAEILQQIAKALRISAEALYVQAGILEERQGDSDVPNALLTDDRITERQKAVLLEIYDSFRKENEAAEAKAAAEALDAAALEDVSADSGGDLDVEAAVAADVEAAHEPVATTPAKARSKKRTPAAKAAKTPAAPQSPEVGG
jgi:transcriptional regulator with XRE-family HTH domain